MEELKVVQPSVSIIVPVYKAEQYLHKCIDSILAQTLRNIELILVDDGSPDGSGSICDEYVEKDGRVRVIHKQNGGVSSARNAGIDAAVGEWLCFVDSDDYIDKQYLEDFNFVSGNADMYMQGYKRVYQGHVLSQTGFEGFNSKKFDLILAYSEINHIINSPCFKLYKKKIICENHLRFDTNSSFGEDHLFSLSYVNCIKKIVYSNGIGYNYIATESESLTRRHVPYQQITYYIKETGRLSSLILKKYNERALQCAFEMTHVDNVVRAIKYFYASSSHDYSDYNKMIDGLDLQKITLKGKGIKRGSVLFLMKFTPQMLSYYFLKIFKNFCLL